MESFIKEWFTRYSHWPLCSWNGHQFLFDISFLKQDHSAIELGSIGSSFASKARLSGLSPPLLLLCVLAAQDSFRNEMQISRRSFLVKPFFFSLFHLICPIFSRVSQTLLVTLTTMSKDFFFFFFFIHLTFCDLWPFWPFPLNLVQSQCWLGYFSGMRNMSVCISLKNLSGLVVKQEVWLWFVSAINQLRI